MQGDHVQLRVNVCLVHLSFQLGSCPLEQQRPSSQTFPRAISGSVNFTYVTLKASISPTHLRWVWIWYLYMQKSMSICDYGASLCACSIFVASIHVIYLFWFSPNGINVEKKKCWWCGMKRTEFGVRSAIAPLQSLALGIVETAGFVVKLKRFLNCYWTLRTQFSTLFSNQTLLNWMMKNKKCGVYTSIT